MKTLIPRLSLPWFVVALDYFKFSDMKVTISINLVWMLVATTWITYCNGASAHIHMHQHNKIIGNERTEDGAFSPRNMDHYLDGEHHQEFDHEAILGMFNYNLCFLNKTLNLEEFSFPR